MISHQTKLLLDRGDWISITSLEDLGYIYYGPLLFNYFDWLKTEIGDSDKILFNSREGLFLQEIYELFREKYNLPPSVYFKTSRTLSTIVSIFNTTDIFRTFDLHRYNGKLSNLLKRRFGISPVIENDVIVDSNETLPNLDLYLKEIIQKSKITRDEYKKYITEVIGDSKNVLMVDTGYQGTTQYNIEKAYGLKFKGRYITYKGNPLLEDVKGFYDFETHKLKDNIIFLESVLTDKVGTYIDIINGEFINEDPSENQIYFDKKIEIVNGIKKFVLDMFDSNDISNDWISKTLPDYMFDLMCKDGYIKNDSLFDEFFHDNNYTRDITKKINRN
jgi:hypothetical protein